VFFDECDSLFENRDRGSRNVNLLLTEIERYNGLVFMATNRPQEIDEAMIRRVTLAVEFRKPDATLREEIWRALVPKKLLPAEDMTEGWHAGDGLRAHRRAHTAGSCVRFEHGHLIEACKKGG
jgi:SpoVK/Ycf46/Vps4 family AAA+-type ATPase